MPIFIVGTINYSLAPSLPLRAMHAGLPWKAATPPTMRKWPLRWSAAKAIKKQNCALNHNNISRFAAFLINGGL